MSNLEIQNGNVVHGRQIITSHDDPSLSATIVELIEQHRQRVDLHTAEKSLTLRIKAKCRRLCEGDKKQAEILYKQMMLLVKNKNAEQHDLAKVAFAANIPFLEARMPIEKSRKQIEKRIEVLAEQLPLGDFVEETRGFSWGSAASIIGETGDLNNYATVARLWKRLGLAVIDGERQRRVGGAEAFTHCYVPHRRAIVWNVGACLIKTGNKHYRAIYDRRKEYESDRVKTKGHAHNRAKRYMEKRFIKDLWIEWHIATGTYEEIEDQN